ncbi:MAG: hypothetical protein HKN21_17840 [Candidatus Eisenbacteria bacterium]|uniref:DUF948 domain-containing protein n=1 Tax=Eiseniibacteriota bacterium TaxID=2212470 RepID=A0A7Y2H3Y1_UNCEI|nr:hypothetical protein [Candidatus Eisenbacteria bacterium]
MSFTITLSEFLAIVSAGALVVATYAITRLSLQLTRTSKEVKDVLLRLEPRLDETLESANSELRNLRQVTARAEGIASHTERLVAEVTDTTVPVLEDLDSLRESKRYLVAAAKGVSTGVQALKRLQTS